MIKQIQAARSTQTPVAFTPAIGRKPSNSSFNQQFYGVLTPYLSGADKAKAVSAPSSPVNPVKSFTRGISQKIGTPAIPRQTVGTAESTVAKVSVPNGFAPRVTATGSASGTGSTVATTPTVTTPTTTTPVVTVPTVEYTPEGKPLPPSLGFIHIIQPKTVTPAATTAPVPKNEYERYWASQPQAVQELKDIEDPTARKLKAWDLANQGYTIDVPIMVWEWDPQYTMELRKSYGYTWVPSALQDTVAIAPGLKMPGVTAYDPAHPPPGSILVNTDFV